MEGDSLEVMYSAPTTTTVTGYERCKKKILSILESHNEENIIAMLFYIGGVKQYLGNYSFTFHG